MFDRKWGRRDVLPGMGSLRERREDKAGEKNNKMFLHLRIRMGLFDLSFARFTQLCLEI